MANKKVAIIKNSGTALDGVSIYRTESGFILESGQAVSPEQLTDMNNKGWIEIVVEETHPQVTPTIELPTVQEEKEESPKKKGFLPTFSSDILKGGAPKEKNPKKNLVSTLISFFLAIALLATGFATGYLVRENFGSIETIMGQKEITEETADTQNTEEVNNEVPPIYNDEIPQPNENPESVETTPVSL